MSNAEFREYMKKSKWGEDKFFTSYYQIPCQIGLYYVDDDEVYHPRFNRNISEEEAITYLKAWFPRYYVPNPYTKRGFLHLEKPVLVEYSIYEYLKEKKENTLEAVCNEVFKESIGNPDIFINTINRYSSLIRVQDKRFYIKEGAEKMVVTNSRDDKKGFFDSFDSMIPKQEIYYGVPGSGKSNRIDEITADPKIAASQKVRVVFHPDYSNADFVGQIMPRKEGGVVDYPFKAGPFTRILKKAYAERNKPFYLIIEEINRGNAAAIFGDIFQLLDRGTNGWSKYEITNEEVCKIILGDEKAKEMEYMIKLPPNLSILATMNTSDQNVFTLDNAFQRRWNMIHVKNEFQKNEESTTQRKALIDKTSMTWEMFLFGDGEKQGINAIIAKSSSVNGMSSLEDKRLGCWFVINKGGKIAKEDFSDKVLKYLWDDAFHFDKSVFADGIESFDELVYAFENGDQLFKELHIDYESKNDNEPTQSGE